MSIGMMLISVELLIMLFILLFIFHETSYDLQQPGADGSPALLGASLGYRIA